MTLGTAIRRVPSSRTVCACLLAALLLAGCGKKGRLYLPEDAAAAAVPVPVAARARAG